MKGKMEEKRSAKMFVMLFVRDGFLPQQGWS